MNNPTTAEMVLSLRDWVHGAHELPDDAQLLTDVADRLEAEEIEGNRSEDYLNSDDVIEVIRQLNLAESTIKAISELPDKWREDCCVSIGMVKLAVELKADELQAIIKEHKDG